MTEQCNISAVSKHVSILPNARKVHWRSHVSRGRGGVEQVELGVGTDRHLVVGEDVYRCQAIREGTTPSPPARGMRVNPRHVAMLKKI